MHAWFLKPLPSLIRPGTGRRGWLWFAEESCTFPQKQQQEQQSCLVGSSVCNLSQALLCFFRAWFCTQREVEERTEKTVKGRRWGVLAEAVCHAGEWRLSFIGESQLRSCSAREGLSLGF
ncbi:hypothetical protein AAC387_Pa06g1494 [Persea americana]